MDTTTSASTMAWGSHSSPRSVNHVWSRLGTSTSVFRSTNGASTACRASRRPELWTTNWVSRRCPGPSATVTSAAPSLLMVRTVAAINRGSVLMAAPGSYSTKFGLRTTVFPATSAATALSPSKTIASRSTSYEEAFTTATRDRPGIGNAEASHGRGARSSRTSAAIPAPAGGDRCPGQRHRVVEEARPLELRVERPIDLVRGGPVGKAERRQGDGQRQAPLPLGSPQPIEGRQAPRVGLGVGSLQRNECDGRRLRIRGQIHHEDDPVSVMPPATQALAVRQDGKAVRQRRVGPRPQELKGQNRVRGGLHPSERVGSPAPTTEVGVMWRVGVGREALGLIGDHVVERSFPGLPRTERQGSQRG